MNFFGYLVLILLKHWWHWVLIISIILIDFHFLSKACKTLPTGTVYAIFAGAGTVGTSFMDIFLFGGSLNFGKICCVIVIVTGVVGLKLADNSKDVEVTKEGA